MLWRNSQFFKSVENKLDEGVDVADIKTIAPVVTEAMAMKSKVDMT